MVEHRTSNIMPRPHEDRQEWFQRVVCDHYNLMFVTAFTTLGDRQEAEDAVQTAVLKAYQRISTLKEPKAIVAWLKMIVRNTALDAVRARRPDHATSDPSDFGGLSAPQETPVEDNDRQQLVLECINELPETQAAVVELRVIYERDINDIAESLGLTANAVRVRLHRGLERLRADPRVRRAFGWEDH